MKSSRPRTRLSVIRVLPQIREYPRLATTATNATRPPLWCRYVERLAQALAERGFHRRLYIMQSTGGILTTGVVRKIPVQIMESGPAAGVLAAAHIGRLTENSRVISFDMGGTTAKAGLVENYEPRTVSRFQAGEWLLGIPSLDLVEIGGRRSIAGSMKKRNAENQSAKRCADPDGQYSKRR
jgi:N-methylhydantoinase A